MSPRSIRVISEAYRARRNFINTTLTRASFTALTGSMDTPHIEIVVSLAVGLSGNASAKMSGS